VFLLGHWKNYDDLESSLCFEELLVTLNAAREKERRDRVFFAALQGVDLEEEAPDPVTNDIVKLKGYQAQQEGFGIGMGLGYMEIED
jgi:hypothetical protein